MSTKNERIDKSNNAKTKIFLHQICCLDRTAGDVELFIFDFIFCQNVEVIFLPSLQKCDKKIVSRILI